MPVTHVLHKGPVKVLESEGCITRFLANEVRFHTSKPINVGSLSQMIKMVSIYTDNGGNHELFQRPPFTNHSQSRQTA